MMVKEKRLELFLVTLLVLEAIAKAVFIVIGTLAEQSKHLMLEETLYSSLRL